MKINGVMKNEGCSIPPKLFNDENLSFVEMVLLVKIDYFDNDKRGCFASNEALGLKIRKTSGSTANIISKLKKKGYIVQLWFDGRKRGLRVPSLKNESRHNNKMKPSQNNESSLNKEIEQPSQNNEHKDKSKDKSETLCTKNNRELTDEEQKILDEYIAAQKKNGKKKYPIQEMYDLYRKGQENAIRSVTPSESIKNKIKEFYYLVLNHIKEENKQNGHGDVHVSHDIVLKWMSDFWLAKMPNYFLTPGKGYYTFKYFCKSFEDTIQQINSGKLNQRKDKPVSKTDLKNKIEQIKKDNKQVKTDSSLFAIPKNKK